MLAKALKENNLRDNYVNTPGRVPALSNSIFKKISDIVYDRAGIKLTSKKKQLVIGRLQKIMRNKGFESYERYINYLREDINGSGILELIDRISTNYSYFYRESDHFVFLNSRILPEITETQKKLNEHDIRFWCAGCATGEESYTLMMLIMKYLGGDYSRWKGGLLATDISANSLEVARKGIYKLDKIANVPAELKNRYFRKIDHEYCAVDERVKSEIVYRRFNLMNQQFPFKKRFHVIFCRNVMIYFDEIKRRAVIDKFANYLMPGGYLFIGHSESILGKNRNFSYVRPAVYKRKELT